MAFPNLVFTDEGKSLQLKSMNGDSTIFTKVAIGNGEKPSDISKLTQLNNQLYVCGITNFENKETYAIIHWSLDTNVVTSAFDWTEYGVFAKDSSGNEVLYAYAYDDIPQNIPSAEDSSITQIETDINIALGDAENVSAVIGEYSAYADKKVVENHINDNNNPHNVTAEQIGLGNVDNVSTNNAAPTFTASTALSEIVSGEKATSLWGKVKTAVKALIDHINNKNNPHGITVAKIGAASVSHTHSASDINSGILSAVRGGTGYSSISSMLNAFGLTNMQLHSHYHNSDGGSYIFTNKMYVEWGKTSIFCDGNSYNTTSIDYGANYFASNPFVFTTINTTSLNRHSSIIDVSRRGFTIVFQNNSSNANTNTINYLVIGYLTNL